MTKEHTDEYDEYDEYKDTVWKIFKAVEMDFRSGLQ